MNRVIGDAVGAIDSLVNSVLSEREYIGFTFKVKTDNIGISNDNQFKLPLHPTQTYDCLINWGDGTTTAQTNNTSPTHTYPAEGTYTIEITGDFPQIYFNNTDDKAKLIEIIQWGNVTWDSFLRAFYGCSNLERVGGGNINLSPGGISLNGLFWNCNSLESVDMLGFDTTDMTDFRWIFRGCQSLKSLNIANFDTSSATTMQGMFYDCQSLEDLNISNFNTSNVINMNAMFYNCAAIESIDVSGWNTSNVTDLSQIFWNCTSLNNIDVSNWDVSSVTTMAYMFRNTNLTSIDLSSWDVSSVTNMFAMFWNSSNLTSYGDITGWNVSLVTNMKEMFRQVGAFDQDISSWNITSITDMTRMFFGVTISTTNYSNILIGWESQAVQNNVIFDGGNSKYLAGAAATARAALIADHSWVITDGGPA